MWNIEHGTGTGIARVLCVRVALYAHIAIIHQQLPQLDRTQIHPIVMCQCDVMQSECCQTHTLHADGDEIGWVCVCAAECE